MINNIQIDGPTEEIMPLEPLAKFEAFGLNVIRCAGNNIRDFVTAVNERKLSDKCSDYPDTIPGYGVDFMEYDFSLHGKPPAKGDEAKTLKHSERYGVKRTRIRRRWHRGSKGAKDMIYENNNIFQQSCIFLLAWKACIFDLFILIQTHFKAQTLRPHITVTSSSRSVPTRRRGYVVTDRRTKYFLNIAKASMAECEYPQNSPTNSLTSQTRTICSWRIREHVHHICSITLLNPNSSF